MDSKLTFALNLAWSVGFLYSTYKYLNKPTIQTLSKEQTQKIHQQIKYRMMIYCIKYAKSIKKIQEQNPQMGKEKILELRIKANNRINQYYIKKEQHILLKYSVSQQLYHKSLEKWNSEKNILLNTIEIHQMMDCAIFGKIPNLKISQKAYLKFKPQQILNIYKQMLTEIAKKVTQRISQLYYNNKKIDYNKEQQVIIALGPLKIYDFKINFLKKKGFQEIWGCPNQIFVKYLESQRLKNQGYDKKATILQKNYKKIFSIANQHPTRLTNKRIDEIFQIAVLRQECCQECTWQVCERCDLRNKKQKQQKQRIENQKVRKRQLLSNNFLVYLSQSGVSDEVINILNSHGINSMQLLKGCRQESLVMVGIKLKDTIKLKNLQKLVI